MVSTNLTGAAPADQERKPPGRPRSARVDEAIIGAVLDLLAEGTPFDALSIEAVAARAGVGKATIYRRWTSRETLLVDAVSSLKGPMPATAGLSVREDLLALLAPLRGLRDNRFGQIMPCLLGSMQRSPELSRVYQQLSEPRRERIREVLRRGIAEGTLRADLDLEIVLSMLVGPLVAQAMTNLNPNLDREQMPSRLLDALWPAITA